jgi:hypothetical protein
MNKSWKTGFTALLLGTMIMQGGIPVFAADAPGSTVSAPSVNYGLTQDVRVAIKSASVVSTAKGLQVAATVRLYNGSATLYRIPEHELRIHTSAGLVYTLKPSTGNKATLQPKEIGEFVYMSIIDSKDQIQLDKLSFVNVDLYSYPKVETDLLSIPLAFQVWYETGDILGTNLSPLGWGQSFSIPGVNSGIVYTPVDYSEQTSTTGLVKVVTVLAQNQGSGRETLPDFRINGLTETKSYEGKRVEKEPVSLLPSEKKYIHFAIPIENGVTLSNLLVTTTDVFVSSNGAQAAPVQTEITTGKLSITAAKGVHTIDGSAVSYTIGTPIAFDPLSTFIGKDESVSLMGLELYENKGEGYQTAILKLKLTNNGLTPLPMNAPAVDLITNDGYSYPGTKNGAVQSASQTSAGSSTQGSSIGSSNQNSTMSTSPASQVLPGTSSVISYSFVLPLAEKSEQFVMKLSDDQTAAPYKNKIAMLQMQLQKDAIGFAPNTVLHMYPYDITLKDWNISAITQGQGQSYSYTYKIKTSLDISNADLTLADANFTKLAFELLDGGGDIVASKSMKLTGSDRLYSGDQTISMDGITSQISNPLTLNIYETISTANGEARRLLFSYKQ